MSTWKTFALIAAVVIIAAAGYWYWSGGELPEMGGSSQSGASVLSTATSDTSDTAIDKDTAAIDIALKASANDSKNTESAFNDKQITQ